MKRNLLLLALLPVVAYFGVKLYLHIQVGKSVDTFVTQASPAADIRYERVTSGVDGRIGLENVTIRPVGVDDEIEIAEVSIKFPDLMYVLFLEDRIEEQKLPQSLSLKIHDARVATRGKLVAAWEEAMFQHDPEARLQAFKSCVSRINLPTQMHLLDYDQIRGSFEAGYYYDATGRRLVMHASAGQIDGVTVDSELALILESLNVAALGYTMTNPEIAGARLEITDAGYFQRVFDYCEKQDDLSREQVVASLTSDLLEMFEGLPMQPDEPLVTAYTEFVSGGSSIVVTAAPREPKRLQYLSLYDPLDVPAVLNINARVN